ncbi:MAG: M20/M25/M40 family metallo-hydrolase [Bacteroidales bacterium]
MKNLICALVLTLIVTGSFSQNNALEKGLDAITKQAVQGQLEFLASDWTEGRETGHRGAYIAGDYIASIFKIYGLEPAGDYKHTEVSRSERWAGKKPERYRSFFQEFNLIKSKPGDCQEFRVISRHKNAVREVSFNDQTDFSITGASTCGMQCEAPVVFAGYGYVNEEEGYDDFSGVDINGKVIIRLAGFPGIEDTASEAYKKFHPKGRYGYYYLNRDKDKEARERGAIAIIEEGGPSLQDQWAVNVPFRYNSENYEGETERESPYEYRYSLTKDTLKNTLLEIRVTPRVMNYILEGSGINPDEYRKRVTRKMKPEPAEIEDKHVFIHTTVVSEIIRARNVIGKIGGKQEDSVIVLGAHYDHLGYHNGYIWNGADDNASGTVGVMTIAKAFQASGQQPEKTLLFAAWTGEEKGLLGSSYFVDNPPIPLEDIILNMNFDMISRDGKEDTLGIECRMGYTKSHPSLKEMTDKNNEAYDLGLEMSYWASEGGRGGSDHAPFSVKGIPFTFFIAGFTPDYHQPTDEASKVNFDKMTKIITLGYINAWGLANDFNIKQGSGEMQGPGNN